LPDGLEELDLLLVMHAKPCVVQCDGTFIASHGDTVQKLRG
jgi:hypothetical protein